MIEVKEMKITLCGSMKFLERFYEVKSGLERRGQERLSLVMKDYGCIIELEKMSSEEDKEKVLKELKQKLNELGGSLIPKEVFKEKFDYYKNNWRYSIKDELG
ncbi:hypothetical protein CMI44_00695 [Candidatus Pacearchaeota archaeon]|nr:hypothetical protein [Candidatus Pacearchaeota archaeon]